MVEEAPRNPDDCSDRGPLNGVVVADFSRGEQEALFSRNAARFYRIEL